MSKETLAVVGSAGVFLLAVALLFVRSWMKETFDGTSFVAIRLGDLCDLRR